MTPNTPKKHKQRFEHVDRTYNNRRSMTRQPQHPNLWKYILVR